MAVPMVSSPEGLIFEGFAKRLVASFRVRGRRGTSLHSDVFCNVSKVVLCGRCNTSREVFKDALQFSRQAQHFGRVQRHFAWQAQHFRCVVLRFFANRIVRAASSGDKVQIPFSGVAFCEIR